VSHADPTSFPGRRFRTVRLASDERLAKRAAAGDEQAFAAIYQRYRQDLYRFCLAIVRSPQDAQDVLQNIMVKVLRALPGETRQIQLKPWLYRIAHNEAVETLRRRRDNTELDPEIMGSGDDPSESAATRERLRQLFADLANLPERQRSALVMRELSGLGFEEIGEALEASSAGARQTVYEARLGLRQMEAGREMRCRSVMWDLSEADGRVVRRRDIQAHLRACPECRAFAEEVEKRGNDFAAIAPLPLAVSAGLLQGLLSGSASSAGVGASGSLAGAAAVGVGKSAAISTGMKAAATVAIAAVGVTAADRSGVIETPLPSSIGGAKSSGSEPGTGAAGETPGQLDRSDPPPARVVDSTGGTSKPAIGPGGEAGQRSAGSAQPPALPSGSGELVQGPNEPSSNGRGHPKGNKGKGGNGGGRSSDAPAKPGHEKKNAPKKTGKPPSPPKGNPPPGSTKAKTKGNSSPPKGPPGTEVGTDKGAGDTFQPSKPEVKGASSGSAGPSKEAR
jgi:RNA polymerase sigma factor (sigma-70 family)